MSTIALQDIVEGQQRATNGLVTLLLQERTTAESTTRDLTSLSQHFLMSMPDFEQKYPSLESSIRASCSLPTSGALPRALHVPLDSV